MSEKQYIGTKNFIMTLRQFNKLQQVLREATENERFQILYNQLTIEHKTVEKDKE